MPKVKIKRKNHPLDMAPMTDVAFLLLTFFMLTSNFTQKQPVKVDTPSSISEIKIPETNIMMVLVDKTGKVFFNVDGQQARVDILKKMGETYQIDFTEKELKEFAIMGSFGVPMNAMKAFLDMSPEDRDRAENAIGIPCDSVDNQFKNWVAATRINKGNNAVLAIKADKETSYPAIKKVMKSLQQINENRYNLVTGLEKESDF
jgi:biopolymer transport protein ExbD